MGIQFNHPWLLVLLLPLAAGIFYAYRSDYRLSGTRKKMVLCLRSVILVLLVLILAGTQIYTVVQQKNIVYLVDRSYSMTESEQVKEWMLKAAAAKEDEDTISIVSTGLDAAVERKPSVEQLTQINLSAALKREFSNLQSGLQLSSSLAQDRGDSRIVLISDGEENVGSMLNAGRILKDQGITVDVLEVPRVQIQDVSVEEVIVPEKLYQAEAFYMEVLLRSTYAASGELRLYEDNREIGRQSVQVTPGENRYALKGIAKSTGLHRYRAEIFMDGDGQSANNAGYAFTRVDGPPKVLIVEGEQDTSGNIAAALSSGLLQYEVLHAAMLPSELAKYAAYDSILFNNVSGDQVGERKMEMIEQAVRSYGIGFMMVGGEDSFGMGGYFKTPIEKLLPVSMELEGKREIPSLGLILVIDRSGSMMGSKMEMAKEAAIRTIELLRSKDTVGVLAFDHANWWAVPTQKLQDKEEVIGLVQSIQSDGGTDIYPALSAAYDEIKELDTQRKHIILLTDGQSAGYGGYDELTEQMKNDKITLSTVAVGMDSDTNLLQQLAEMAKGRYYFAEDETTIPAIFSREAAMIAQTYIVDKPFVPALADQVDWSTTLFGDGAPAVYGYVATTPKAASQTVLVSPEPDPLLSRWQYGSGRTVAWTSDLTGKWSKEWVSWPAFSNVLTQMVKWTFPQFTASAFHVQTELNGNTVSLEVTASGDDAPERLQAVVASEAQEEVRVELVQEAPGQYTGELQVADPGAFLLSLVDASGEGEGETLQTSGLVVPYSPEYRLSDGNASQGLQRLAELTGGRMLSLDQPEQLFAPVARSSRELHDISYALLAAALLLWVADIAVRRLALPWGAIAARVAASLRRRPAPAAEAADGAGLTRLAARKSRAATFYGGAAKPPPSGSGAREEAGAMPASRPAPSARVAPKAAPEARRAKQPGEMPAAAQPEAQPPSAEATSSMDRLLAAKKRNTR